MPSQTTPTSRAKVGMLEKSYSTRIAFQDTRKFTSIAFKTLFYRLKTASAFSLIERKLMCSIRQTTLSTKFCMVYKSFNFNDQSLKTNKLKSIIINPSIFPSEASSPSLSGGRQEQAGRLVLCFLLHRRPVRQNPGLPFPNSLPGASSRKSSRRKRCT